MMNYEKLLSSLKLDIPITTTAYDNRLREYLRAAEAEITREGITLDPESMDDQNLVVMYAAHMWRKRDTGEGIPRMIRWQMNNRLFSQNKGGESE